MEGISGRICTLKLEVLKGNSKIVCFAEFEEKAAAILVVFLALEVWIARFLLFFLAGEAHGYHYLPFI